MPRSMCGATAELVDGRILTCGAKPGHPGPTHADRGEQWTDPSLLTFPEPDMPDLAHVTDEGSA